MGDYSLESTNIWWQRCIQKSEDLGLLAALPKNYLLRSLFLSWYQELHMVPRICLAESAQCSDKPCARLALFYSEECPRIFVFIF